MNPIIETIFLLLSFAGFTAGCTMFFSQKNTPFIITASVTTFFSVLNILNTADHSKIIFSGAVIILAFSGILMRIASNNSRFIPTITVFSAMIISIIRTFI